MSQNIGNFAPGSIYGLLTLSENLGMYGGP